MMKVGYTIPSFIVSIDSSNVSKLCTLSTSHKYINCGVYQHHFIFLDGLDQYEFKMLLRKPL